MNVVQGIESVSRTRPEADALILIDGMRVSYAMLDMLIRRAAAFGSALGFKPGDRVAMRIGGNDEALGLIVALGLARIGVATCDPTVPARHLSAALVAPGESAPAGPPHHILDARWISGAASAAGAHPGGEALFRVFATSGTTGLPRYCPVSHAIMGARVTATGYPIARTDFSPVVLCALGLDGNWAMRTVLATLSGGGTLVFSNAASLADTLTRQRVTTLITSPVVLQTLLAAIPAGQPRPPALRAAVIGGSRLGDPLWRLATLRLCPDIMTTFGASETSVVAMGHHETLSRVANAVGVLEPGVAAQAVDAAHRALPPGIEGLIRVRTPGDIAGYLDDPEATAATFRDGWFYTGDIGSVTADGMLVITGRAVELINHGGMKISPRLVEDALLAVPEITQAAAFGVPDSDGVTQVWAAVVAAAPIDGDTLRRHCQASLGQLAPRYVMQMPELPRNANGKVMTHALVALATRQAHA